MKKIIAMIVVMAFFFGLPILTYADERGKKQYRKNDRGRYERVYPKNHPYHHPHGHAYGYYKNDRNMHRRNYKYKRHYSWREWQRHRHEYDRYRHKVYHHDDRGFMMFSFCEDANERICFSISID